MNLYETNSYEGSTGSSNSWIQNEGEDDNFSFLSLAWSLIPTSIPSGNTVNTVASGVAVTTGLYNLFKKNHLTGVTCIASGALHFWNSTQGNDSGNNVQKHLEQTGAKLNILSDSVQCVEGKRVEIKKNLEEVDKQQQEIKNIVANIKNINTTGLDNISEELKELAQLEEQAFNKGQKAKEKFVSAQQATDNAKSIGEKIQIGLKDLEQLAKENSKDGNETPHPSIQSVEEKVKTLLEMNEQGSKEMNACTQFLQEGLQLQNEMLEDFKEIINKRNSITQQIKEHAQSVENELKQFDIKLETIDGEMSKARFGIEQLEDDLKAQKFIIEGALESNEKASQSAARQQQVIRILFSACIYLISRAWMKSRIVAVGVTLLGNYVYHKRDIVAKKMDELFFGEVVLSPYSNLSSNQEKPGLISVGYFERSSEKRFFSLPKINFSSLNVFGLSIMSVPLLQFSADKVKDSFIPKNKLPEQLTGRLQIKLGDEMQELDFDLRERDPISIAKVSEFAKVLRDKVAEKVITEEECLQVIDDLTNGSLQDEFKGKSFVNIAYLNSFRSNLDKLINIRKELEKKEKEKVEQEKQKEAKHLEEQQVKQNLEAIK